MAKISIIVAASNNNVIGVDNCIPWHIPADLKFFKSMTENKVVIMGRKSWESLPEKHRPLRNRLNVVITRNKDYIADGGIVAYDLESLFKAFKNSSNDDDEIFVIGGGEIYKDSFPYADKLYLTRVLTDVEVEGDTYFEGFNEEEWELEHGTEVMEENGYKFSFQVYNKKTPDKLGS